MITDNLFSESALENIPAETANNDVTASNTERCLTHVILPSQHTTISESAADIFQRLGDARKMFLHGGRVVEVVKRLGEAVLVPVTPAALSSRLDALGPVMMEKVDRETKEVHLHSVLCRESTSKLLLAAPEAQTRLPTITLMSRCPVLVRDGDRVKLLGPGWHPNRGGTLITEDFTRIPLDLKTATALLGDCLLKDFRFSTNADRARAVAAILAPALRFGGLIQGDTPMVLVAADQQGAGKSLLCHLIATVYGVSYEMVTQRQGGVGSFDESVDQALASGSPLVFLDNLKGCVDSPRLEAILTARRPIACRIPNVGSVTVDTSNVVVFGTTNDATISPDLASRSLVIELLKQPAGYPFSDYGTSGIVSHVQQIRHAYLSAIVTVIEEWGKQSFPIADGAKHRMDGWAKSVGGILNMLGLPDFCTGNDASQLFRSEPLIDWLINLAQVYPATALEANTSELIRLGNEHGTPAPLKHGETDKTFARRFGLKASKLLSLDTVMVFGKISVVRTESHNPATRKNETIYRLTKAA